MQEKWDESHLGGMALKLFDQMMRLGGGQFFCLFFHFFEKFGGFQSGDPK